MNVQYPQIERRIKLDREEFHSEYVDKKPVVIEGAVDEWKALAWWGADYFSRIAGDIRVRVKFGDVAKGELYTMALREYLQMIEGYERRLARGEAGPDERPPYLHDLPMLAMSPQLVADLEPFPASYIDSWYGTDWWRFTQFFYGPSHSLTRLHFDSLETHNTFFQIVGRKRFIILLPRERDNCYTFRWRWSHVDPECPDFERYPDFAQAQPLETVVGPGNILYMPPGTLHHVRSLDLAISFNIDWQTRKTAIRGATKIFRGMPLKNAYYNAVLALGQSLKLSPRRLLPLYGSYLEYVS